MKRLILFLIPLGILIIISCNKNSDNPTDSSQSDKKGSILVTSNPAGAEIFLDNTITNLTTPDTVKNVDAGDHSITLRLTEYRDTTIAVTVKAGEMSTVGSVVLVSNITEQLFGPVKIYETSGTTASEPSGLDLSSGSAWGISSDSSSAIDIYYSTTGTGGQPYLIQSADLKSGLIRVTKFYLGSGNNIFDGVDSPDKNDSGWTNHMNDSPDSNYVFLYDHDGHYSKLKIVNSGGGVPGEPKWIFVQWYYNKIVLDNRF